MSIFAQSINQFLEKKPLNTKLTLTAVASSALTAFGVLGYQALRRQQRTRALKRELRSSDQYQNEHNAPKFMDHLDQVGNLTAQPTEFDESLIDQQLARNTEFLGKEGSKKIRDAFVIVVGAGGVGSWAALMLLRSGIGKIRIIDFDQVTLSSLNRHAVATLGDVGTPKVTAIKKHFKDIAPFVEVDSVVDLFTAENADELLSGNPDYVIDAIDNIDTKLDLIKYCYDKKLEVISSMGAGAKADPSRIQIADISETMEDPLARAVRRKLKKMGVEKGVPVAYSTEKPHHVKLLPLEEERVANADDFAALPEFRSRILPVLGTIPSMFGMAIATYILLRLAKFPSFDPLAIKLREGLYARLHRDLRAREMKHYNNKVCPLDVRDVGYIFERMWHGGSIISGPQDRLALTRWDRTKPLSSLNAVCLSRTEADAHDKLPPHTDLKAYYGEDVYSRVETAFQEEEKTRRIWDDVL